MPFSTFRKNYSFDLWFGFNKKTKTKTASNTVETSQRSSLWNWKQSVKGVKIQSSFALFLSSCLETCLTCKFYMSNHSFPVDPLLSPFIYSRCYMFGYWSTPWQENNVGCHIRDLIRILHPTLSFPASSAPLSSCSCSWVIRPWNFFFSILPHSCVSNKWWF